MMMIVIVIVIPDDECFNMMHHHTSGTSCLHDAAVVRVVLTSFNAAKSHSHRRCFIPLHDELPNNIILNSLSSHANAPTGGGQDGVISR